MPDGDVAVVAEQAANHTCRMTMVNDRGVTKELPANGTAPTRLRGMSLTCSWGQSVLPELLSEASYCTDCVIPSLFSFSQAVTLKLGQSLATPGKSR